MEQIHISESNIVIENKSYSASFYAREEMPDGTKRGTFSILILESIIL